MLNVRFPVVHHVYGIDVRTPWPISGTPEADRNEWDVEFIEGTTATFAGAAARVPAAQASWWAQSAALPDGSSYRRWRDAFEFLVTPDARRIHARTLGDTHYEALLAYLLVDALSFSLVRLGREPLHATTIATDHGAVAFIGPSGAGKSTLAALLLDDSRRLLTDDMLVLSSDGDGFLAQPGPPRIKLYRTMADRLLRWSYSGIPMNATTEKLIIPLGSDHAAATPHRLVALYVIETGDHADAPLTPSIHTLTPARAVPAILSATAGHDPSARDRLARQFGFVTRLVRHVPVRVLAYRRDSDAMTSLRDALLNDLGRARL
jgi:hypothetical protein